MELEEGESKEIQRKMGKKEQGVCLRGALP